MSTRAITSAEAGVPGPPTRSDRFGAALASGDFDRDGDADLAIGVPGLDLVTVLYGPPDRLRPAPAADPGRRAAHPARDRGLRVRAACGRLRPRRLRRPRRRRARQRRAAGELRARLGAADSRVRAAGWTLRGAGRCRRRTTRAASAARSPPATSTATATSTSSAGVARRAGHRHPRAPRVLPRAAPHRTMPARPSGTTTPRPRRSPSPTSTTTATRTSCRATRARAGKTRLPERAGRGPHLAGTARTASARSGSTITQGTPGIPGRPAGGDRFGHAVEAGDVDGDAWPTSWWPPRGTRTARERHGHPRIGARPARVAPIARRSTTWRATSAGRSRCSTSTATAATIWWSPARTRRVRRRGAGRLYARGQPVRRERAAPRHRRAGPRRGLAAANRPLTARFAREVVEAGYRLGRVTTSWRHLDWSDRMRRSPRHSGLRARRGPRPGGADQLARRGAARLHREAAHGGHRIRAAHGHRDRHRERDRTPRRRRRRLGPCGLRHGERPLVAGSSYGGSVEVAEGFVTRAGALTVQACRVAGGAGEHRPRRRHAADRRRERRRRASLVRVSTPTRAARPAARRPRPRRDRARRRRLPRRRPARRRRRRQAARRRLPVDTVVIPDLAAQSRRDRAADAAFAAANAESELPSGRTTLPPAVRLQPGPQAPRARAPGPRQADHAQPPHLRGPPGRGHRDHHRPRRPRRQAGVPADGRPPRARVAVGRARDGVGLRADPRLPHGDARAQRLVRRTRTIVVPIVNPDGFNASREAGELQGAGDGRGGSADDETINILTHPNEYRRKNCRLITDAEAGTCLQPALGLPAPASTRTATTAASGAARARPRDPTERDLPRPGPVLGARDEERARAGLVAPGDDADHQPHVLEPGAAARRASSRRARRPTSRSTRRSARR